MATLTAIEFPTADGADRALKTLEDLQKQRLIVVHDAAVVSWPADRKQPKTRQANNLVGAGALGGMFWGMLFGLLFLVPILGMAIGAGIGALTGALTDVGIDDKFIDQVKSKVTPGTSALFVLTSEAVIERVAERFKGVDAEIISTNLSSEDEARLKEVFAEATAAPSA
ncbi:MAG TPA: DUF1269 domain-containing protein [Terriglobales bacterium]|nr:DUF1269 domain-containing protein [Terriglobales bacterium]